MKENISLEQIEKMIENLEKQELLKAPPDFQKKVMAKIAEQQKEEKITYFSERRRRFFYQIKIAGAMAASILLLIPSGQSLRNSSLESVTNISIQQNILTNKMRQGTDHLNRDLHKISGYMMKRITEVVAYEK